LGETVFGAVPQTGIPKTGQAAFGKAYPGIARNSEKWQIHGVQTDDQSPDGIGKPHGNPVSES